MTANIGKRYLLAKRKRPVCRWHRQRVLLLLLNWFNVENERPSEDVPSRDKKT
jgi:hypothetical protein